MNFESLTVSNQEPKKDKPENMYGISFDPSRQRYTVRLAHEDGKPLITKEFKVLKGDHETAKKKAIAFRNQAVVDYLLPCVTTREGIDFKNNQTGVIGVHKRENRDAYVATWYNEDGNLQRAQFSEIKWTSKQAFFMAWATRLAKKKIFIKDKKTKEWEISPNSCFDIVYDVIGKQEAEKIWDKESERNLPKE